MPKNSSFLGLMFSNTIPRQIRAQLRAEKMKSMMQQSPCNHPESLMFVLSLSGSRIGPSSKRISRPSPRTWCVTWRPAGLLRPRRSGSRPAPFTRCWGWLSELSTSLSSTRTKTTDLRSWVLETLAHHLQYQILPLCMKCFSPPRLLLGEWLPWSHVWRRRVRPVQPAAILFRSQPQAITPFRRHHYR